MRHFREELRADGFDVAYHQLEAEGKSDRGSCFSQLLADTVDARKPQKLIVVEPGDWRVKQELLAASQELAVPIEIREDRHFYCSTEEFRAWADGRKTFVLEHFYRWMRKKWRVLIGDDGQPVGSQWNFDRDNRQGFGRIGPGQLPLPMTFAPDAITREVIEMVEHRFQGHSGSVEHFNLPVCRGQARQMLEHFVANTLSQFGTFEDAMWTDECFLFHSRLSAPLNLKVLDPRECVASAGSAWRTGKAPLNCVEVFVRHILGWWEFVRGIYWQQMPSYADRNFLEHSRDVPSFFWDGETDMQCVRQSMSHVLNHGYSHHIHRLMVLGNLAQLLEVHPLKFHEWHMAMYLDAVDWVSLPNTLGMSQFGDGGIVGTKPHCSTGNYINRMSPFCRDCRYDNQKRTGCNACPFTTLYWDFLDRYSGRLSGNQRMRFALRNLETRRANEAEMADIRERAAELKAAFCG